MLPLLKSLQKPLPPESEGKTITPVDVFLAALPFVPLMLLFGAYFFYRSQNLYSVTDYAIIEIGVHQAKQGTRLVGLYSRFGWFHPGPLYFYLLVPCYTFWGCTGYGLIAGARFIMLSAIVVVLVLVYQSHNRILFLFTSFLISFFIYRGLQYWLEPVWVIIWTPMVTILPFGAFLFIAFYLALGRIFCLPLLIVFGTFLVQTHLGYTFVTVAVLMAALVLGVANNRQNRIRSDSYFTLKKGGWYLLAAVLIFVLLWLPPLFQELKSSPGNLTEIYTFFQEHRAEGQSLTVVLEIMNRQALTSLNFFWEYFSGHKLATPSTSVVLIEVLLLLLFLTLNYRRQQTFLVCMQSLCLIALCASFYSILSIIDEIHFYLIGWIKMIHYLVWSSILYSLLAWLYQFCYSKFKKIRPYMNHGLTLVFGVYACSIIIDHYPQASKSIQLKTAPIIEEFSGALARFVAVDEPPSFTLTLGHKAWSPGAGLACYLVKQKCPLKIEGWGHPQLGLNYNRFEYERYRLHLKHEPQIQGFRDFTPLCRKDQFTLYIKDMVSVRNFKQYLAPQPPEVIDSEGMSGQITVLIDGDFLAQGTRWKTPKTVLFSTSESYLTLKVPAAAKTSIVGLALTLDGNDWYQILGSHDNKEFQPLVTVQSLDLFGMQHCCLLCPEISHFTSLRIQPLSGDGCYSIAEIGWLTGVNVNEAAFRAH
ncbi:hypothetical protein ACFL27_28165 [candidate division CSSED10-310 bacterium]|uniref:Glycosyltransferase RgtA/B/C/D-like domain-containing protein n=1 Tax=candidate division CSSED10-310 bacterium TaxID=2855610 RepID=A0ABV6Z6K6_UNCC1